METEEKKAPAAAAFEFKLKGYELEAHGEKFSVLKFREPTVADILNFGSPVDLAYRPADAVMFVFICQLAAIPPSTAKKIKTRDYLAITQEIVTRFFFPAPAEEPTPIS